MSEQSLLRIESPDHVAHALAQTRRRPPSEGSARVLQLGSFETVEGPQIIQCGNTPSDDVFGTLWNPPPRL